MEHTQEKPPLSQGLKLGIDLGPLLIFFIANSLYGLIPATGALMGATLVALGISWTVARHIPTMPLVAGGLLMVFGGLTVIFDDDIFIKLKPTIVNLMMAGGLAAGLALGRNFLKNILGTAFLLDDEGWRILTIRWIGFFIFLAALNEVVWRSVDTDTWVSFKVFGMWPSTVTFAAAEARLLMKHSLEKDEEQKS